MRHWKRRDGGREGHPPRHGAGNLNRLSSACRNPPSMLIGRPVLASKAAGAIRERLKVHVDVGIADLVIRGAITDDQEDSIGRGVVDEAMAVASAGRKAGARPGRENLLSRIGFKCDLA